MLDTAIQVHLIRQSKFLEDCFRLVTLLSREDLIIFGRCYSQRPLDLPELAFIDVRWVCSVANVGFSRSQMPSDVFTAKAVAYETNPLQFVSIWTIIAGEMTL